MKRILCLFIPLLLIGCTSPFEEQYSQYIGHRASLLLVKHRTTVRQVRALLGTPNVVAPDSRNDLAWIYQRKVNVVSVRRTDAFSRLILPGDSDKILTFFFYNKDNTLKGFRSDRAE